MLTLFFHDSSKKFQCGATRDRDTTSFGQNETANEWHYLLRSNTVEFLRYDRRRIEERDFISSSGTGVYNLPNGIHQRVGSFQKVIEPSRARNPNGHSRVIS